MQVSLGPLASISRPGSRGCTLQKLSFGPFARPSAQAGIKRVKVDLETRWLFRQVDHPHYVF